MREIKDQIRSEARRSYGLAGFLAVLMGTILTAVMLLMLLMGNDVAAQREQEPAKLAMMEKFDMYMNNAVSDAMEGILAIDKVYWLCDEDVVAPEPGRENFGETTDPASLTWLLEDAEGLLGGQEMIFRTDMQIPEGSKVKYYLDETILAVTWQEKEGKTVYTYSEVKIAHPSQFRRFLSDGEYGSGKLYHTTEMAKSINAVTASSGDYYAFRGYGNHVYNGEVMQADNSYLDTCYVDENGDLIMLDYFTVYKKQDVEAFVAENNIRFSLAFGPILVKDGKMVAKDDYPIGEADEDFSRTALCQIGPLHYMLVTVNRRGKTASRFGLHLRDMGVQQAYALDGGQTSTIVMGGELMNPVDYGGERAISDIIYFATALPGGG